MMKKLFLQRLILLAGCASASLSLADVSAISAGISTGPAVTQEYHAGEPNQSATPAQAQAAINAAPVVINTTPAPNAAGIDTSLQAQLSQLNQAALLYQQQADQRIEALTAKNNEISTQLNNLNQVINELNQEMNVLHQAETQLSQTQRVPSTAPHSSQKLWKEWFVWLDQLGAIAYLNFILFAALLFTLGFTASKLRHTPGAAAQDNIKNNTQDDTQDEYNFMSTNEAIPAILDLARAYVAMENFAQAKIEIQKVIIKGNDEQRDEAKTLLAKIK